MYADSHVKLLGAWVLGVLLLVAYHTDHLTAYLDNSVCFVDLYLLVPSFFWNLAIESHYYVTVPNGMDFVAANVIA